MIYVLSRLLKRILLIYFLQKLYDKIIDYILHILLEWHTHRYIIDNTSIDLKLEKLQKGSKNIQYHYNCWKILYLEMKKNIYF